MPYRKSLLKKPSLRNPYIPRNCGVFLFEKFSPKQNKEYLILRHRCLWHTQIDSNDFRTVLGFGTVLAPPLIAPPVPR